VREVLGTWGGVSEVLVGAASWDGGGGAVAYVQVLLISRDVQFTQGGPCSSHYVKVSLLLSLIERIACWNRWDSNCR
jgi:hypothetical protein